MNEWMDGICDRMCRSEPRLRIEKIAENYSSNMQEPDDYNQSEYFNTKFGRRTTKITHERNKATKKEYIYSFNYIQY